MHTGQCNETADITFKFGATFVELTSLAVLHKKKGKKEQKKRLATLPRNPPPQLKHMSVVFCWPMTGSAALQRARCLTWGNSAQLNFCASLWYI